MAGGVQQADDAFSTEEDLGETWRKVVSEIREKAHLDLKSDTFPTIESVIGIISPVKVESSAVEKATQVFVKTLEFAQRVGGILAQVGSIAFGGSQQVLNAVGFVVQICQGVEGVFSNLTVVMRRIGFFLERLCDDFAHKDRFGLEKENVLDKDLRRSVYRVLRNFVNVMALAYDLGYKWQEQAKEDESMRKKAKRFWKRTKVAINYGAFNDDSGVHNAIEEFEQSVAAVTTDKIDKIQREASDTAKALAYYLPDIQQSNLQVAADVRKISTAVEQISSAENNKAALKRLRESLAIKESDDELALQSHASHEDKLEGTAEWVLEADNFKWWTETAQQSSKHQKIMAIQGPPGYGKSYLAHSIINTLQDMSHDPTIAGLKIRVAWHYFYPEGKGTSVNKAIKHVIYQLAKADGAYLNFLKDTGNTYVTNEKDVVKPLIEEYMKKHPPDTFWFIILDGIDKAQDDGRNTLSNLIRLARYPISDGLRIRLMLTGSADYLRIAKQKASSSWDTIDLNPPDAYSANALPQYGDIKAFVNKGLSECSVLEGYTADDDGDLRTELLDGLIDAARGDWESLKAGLKDFKAAEDIPQVRQALQTAKEGPVVSKKKEISKLNESDRIREYNHIFMWISAAYRIEAKTLKSVIALVTDDNGMKDPAGFLRRYCPKLVNVDDQDEIEFAAYAREALEDAPAERTTIAKGVVDIIEAMVKEQLRRTFGEDQSVYKDFNFGQFFEQKRKESTQTELIHLPKPDEIAYRVLDTCLRAVCDESGEAEKFKPLQDYASRNFARHLLEAKMETAPSEIKQQIGLRMFRMLREEPVMDVWMQRNTYWDMLDWLDFDSNKFCDDVITLLSDADVRRNLQPMTAQSDWLVRAKDAELPQAEVLQFISRYSLTRWYKSEEVEEDYMPFIWLRQYFHKLGPHRSEYGQDSWYTDATLLEIERWQEWAKKELKVMKVDVDEASWLCRLAGTYDMLGSKWNAKPNAEIPLKAQSLCEEAIKLNASHWRARYLLGSLLEEAEAWQRCIDLVASTNEEHAGLLGHDEAYDHLYWTRAVPLMGSCFEKLGDPEGAVLWYRKLVDHQLVSTSAEPEFAVSVVASLIRAHIELGHLNEALDLLKDLDTRKPSKGTKTWLHKALADFSDDFHDALIKLGCSTESYEVLSNYYAKAIDNEETSPGEPGTSTYIECMKWKLQWFCGTLESQSAAVSGLESAVKESASNRPGVWRGRRPAVRALAYALAHHAKLSSRDHEQVNEHIDGLKSLSKTLSTVYALESDTTMNPNLTLARVYHLQGEQKQARMALLPSLRSAFELIRNGDDERDQSVGFKILALILPMVDQDDDARAAWSLLGPLRSQSQAAEEAPVNGALTNDKDASSPDIKHNEDSNGSKHPELENQANSTPAMNSTSAPAANGVQPTSTLETIQPPGEAKSEVVSNLPLSGPLNLFCDGCRHKWSYPDEIWVCRDCLCVQLCPNCYNKLKAHRLTVLICDADHSHFFIDKFNEEAWRAQPPDQVLVRGDWMRTEKWLDEMAEKWKLFRWRKLLARVRALSSAWKIRKDDHSPQPDENTDKENVPTGGENVDTADRMSDDKSDGSGIGFDLFE